MASGALGVGERINGVNLGNWLVLEKWMKPGIFAASGEADEIWLHRATESAELEALLTRHRDTYITEADFRNIAAHGCNLVRIPVPYFIFGDVSGHPGCIEYLDRAFDWAERTGLKILIDLHTVPGSQNGFDNGGLTGVVRWHHSPRAVAYALNVLACLARRYRDRTALFGIEVLNEPIDWLTYATSSSSRQAKDNFEARRSGPIQWCSSSVSTVSRIAGCARFWPRTKSLCSMTASDWAVGGTGLCARACGASCSIRISI